MPVPQHRRLRCFVASAFGYADVDSVFSKLIKPTLRDLDVDVRRVDRVNHNDDIDDKIMELLQEADFCIADLTYARPSVYFEAGFAGATKPVIYVARRDHFRARDNDPAGIQRVHFDLQMKNIIPWGGSASEFGKKLSRRVKLVTRPLARKLVLATERAIEREAFLALSERQRIEALEKLAGKAVTQHAFKIISKSTSWHRMLGFSSVLDVGKPFVRRTFYCGFILSRSSVLKISKVSLFERHSPRKRMAMNLNEQRSHFSL